MGFATAGELSAALSPKLSRLLKAPLLPQGHIL